MIEMIQGHAAHSTMSDYTRTTSVTSLLQQLGWQILEEGQSVARPCIFYKIVNDIVAVPLSQYIQPPPRISSYCHSMICRQIHTGKDSYKYSFFPLAIVQWNALPENVVIPPSLDLFKAMDGELQHPKQYKYDCLFLTKFLSVLALSPLFIVDPS